MWIIYNGVDSRDLDVTVNAITPVSAKAKRRETEVAIPGRDGVLTIDLGSYEPVTHSVDMTLMLERMTDVLQWLTGKGDLITSWFPDRLRRAKCSAVTEPTYWAAKLYRLTATFTCDPYLYDVSPAVVPVTDDTITLYNTGMATRPTVRMEAGSTITINGSVFSAAADLTIDGENYLVFDGHMNRFSDLTGNLDDFIFTERSNIIEVTGTVVIWPTWRWL